jgi:hypothetical protein
MSHYASMPIDYGKIFHKRLPRFAGNLIGAL